MEKSFEMYREYHEAILALSEEEQLLAIRLICEFAFGEIELEEVRSSGEAVAFLIIALIKERRKLDEIYE